ncbi:type 1 glutamine amidotransferase [Pseudokineococcus basanitobsidens]|uniref:Type 1 glutamine amidotransferase n=1 Tax=Pseudokineococcus basanitobsidens TaxID=1926649 RepID=A0ABU8RHM2_9ACTN
MDADLRTAPGSPAAGDGPGALRVLVVQHEDGCPPALLADALVALGAVVDVVRPDLGLPLPTSLGRRGPGRPAGGHDALVVLGGSAAADDDAAWPWLPAVRGLLAACAADGTPVLGVCLGAQLLAAATGGRTGPAPSGPEHGPGDVEAVPGAGQDPLVAAVGSPPPPGATVGGGPGHEPTGAPDDRTGADDAEQPVLRWRAVQSHGDAVLELPPGARLLASSTACRVQAFAAGRDGTAWGVQYHPEATSELVAGWCASEGTRSQLSALGLTAEDVVAAVVGEQPALVVSARRHARVLLEAAAARRARAEEPA